MKTRMNITTVLVCLFSALLSSGCLIQELAELRALMAEQRMAEQELESEIHNAAVTRQQLETQRAQAKAYTRVAVPATDITKVSWESGAPISPGTPEHCIHSFFDALVLGKEEAMLGCLGTGDQFASARQNVLTLLQSYKFQKQSGATIDTKLIATRLAPSEFAVVDSEMLVFQLGETNSVKYAFVCRHSNDEWKIFSCGATEAAERACRLQIKCIESMISLSLLSGKGFPASVPALFESKDFGDEPKCPFAGGQPYILEHDPERQVYAIHCPCVGLFPSHVLPVEENRMGVTP